MAKSGKRTASISGKKNPTESKRIKKKRDDRAASLQHGKLDICSSLMMQNTGRITYTLGFGSS